MTTSTSSRGGAAASDASDQVSSAAETTRSRGIRVTNSTLGRRSRPPWDPVGVYLRGLRVRNHGERVDSPARRHACAERGQRDTVFLARRSLARNRILASPMSFVDVIVRKRDGQVLSREDIGLFVNG